MASTEPHGVTHWWFQFDDAARCHVALSADASAAAEAAHARATGSDCGSPVASCGHLTMHVTLHLLWGSNYRVNPRPIVRLALPDHAWHYQDTPSVWRPLGPHACAQLEHHVLRLAQGHGPATVRLRVESADYAATYDVDLCAMTQCNASSGTTRRLRRVALGTGCDVPVAATSAAAAAPSSGRVLLDTRSPPPAAAAPPPARKRGADSLVPSPSPAIGSTPATRVHRAESIGATASATSTMTPPVTASPLSVPGSVAGVAAAPTAAATASPAAASLALVPRPPTSATIASTRRRLVFPSISTSIFMFDVARAAKVACGIVAKFLAEHPPDAYPGIELCLIDVGSDGKVTRTIQAFQREWTHLRDARGGTADPRFTCVVADVADHTARGPCFAIANAANRNLRGKGTHGFCRAVHTAAGPGLEPDTLTKYKTLASVGVAYDVPLRHDSPLRLHSGVEHVIHVVGPNMNPTRPDCLGRDYDTGCRQLAECYRNLFECFAALAFAKAP